MDAIRSGWLSKENSKSVLSIKIYGNRWVVLYPHKIVVSHEPDGSKPEENRDIPLKSIILNSPRVSDQPNSVDFSLDCGDRIYVFRAKTPAEASDWKRDISLAVFKCAANEIKPSAKSTDHLASPDIIVVSPQAQRYEEGSDIGKLLYFVTYNQINVMHTAERFFKCIKSTPAKQRSNIAKAMGKAMVLWVGDEANSGEVQPLHHHNNKHIAPTEVLNIWIRVALARELNTSCKFELQAGDTGSVASSAGSTVNSRQSSRRLSQNRGSTIMPFRADSPECLFLSSLVNATAIRSQMLFRSLLPVLQPLVSNAEGFNYPPVQMRTPALLAGGDVDRRPSVDVSGSDGTTGGGGGGGMFSRMMHGFRGNNAHHQQSASGSVPAAAPSATAASKRNSFRFNVRKSLKLTSNSSGSSNPEEDHHQRSINSVRHNIYNVIKELFLILHSMEDSEYPTSLISLVLTLKDLTIDAKTTHSGAAASGGGSGSNTTNSSVRTPNTSHLPAVEESKQEDEVSSRYVDINDLVIDVLDGKRNSGGGGSVGGAGSSSGNLHDEADLHDQLVRFGYGRYYTSCTALLFLRLICPSIINPSDWMLPLSATGGSSSAGDVKESESSASGSGSPCAAMIILSHVIGESSTFSGDGGKHSLDPHISGVMPIPVEEAFKMIEKDSLLVKSKPGKPFASSGHSQPPAELNLMNMTVRKGLAEISKALLHISNIACLPRDEMEMFARESLVRQNVSTGLVDKDQIDLYQLTETERELVTTQLMLANEIQLLYERLGKLQRVSW